MGEQSSEEKLLEEVRANSHGRPVDAIVQQWGRAFKCKSNVDSFKRGFGACVFLVASRAVCDEKGEHLSRQATAQGVGVGTRTTSSDGSPH